MDEEELRQRRVALRLEVVEGLLWAIENADTVLALSQAAPSRDAAVQGLHERHGLTEFVAHHVMDVTFGQVTEHAVERLRNEAIRLRRGEDTSTPRSDLDEQLDPFTIELRDDDGPGTA